MRNKILAGVVLIALVAGFVFGATWDLSDPGADSIMGWDESENAVEWLTAAEILAISGAANKAGETYSGTHDHSASTLVLPQTLNFDGGTVELPNGTADATLTLAGQIDLNETDDQLNFHAGSTGEISGEAALPLLNHLIDSFDPGTWYDSDAERFLMTVGDDYPEGLTIVEWSVSCNIDPDTEIDADLRYADAFIGLANAADIDEIDTTTGTSTEDTNGSINSGAAIANGKVIYIGFDADPEGTCVQMIFEMWFYGEED